MKYGLKSLTLLLVLNFVACSQPGQSSANICQSSQAHTSIQDSGYVIKIFSPNNLIKPDIWEGPICFKKAESNNYCLKDYSLIKNIAIRSDLNIAEITVFSGSNSDVKKVSLASCEELN